MLFSDLRHTRSKVGMLRKRPCWCCTSCPACARRLFMMSCHCVGSIDFNGILGKEKGDSNPDLHEVCHTRLASRYGRLARNLFQKSAMPSRSSNIGRRREQSRDCRWLSKRAPAAALASDIWSSTRMDGRSSSAANLRDCRGSRIGSPTKVFVEHHPAAGSALGRCDDPAAAV